MSFKGSLLVEVVTQGSSDVVDGFSGDGDSVAVGADAEDNTLWSSVGCIPV